MSEGLSLAATLERVQRTVEVPIDAAAAEPRLYLEIPAALQSTMVAPSHQLVAREAFAAETVFRREAIWRLDLMSPTAITPSSQGM